jgi:hypothetical protein
MTKKLGEKWGMVELLNSMKEGYETEVKKGLTLGEFEKSRYEFVKTLLKKVENGTVELR